MDFFIEQLGFDVIGFPEAALRLAMAALLGYVIGYDRHSKNKPIDFRAFMIVAVSTCVIGIMGQELYSDYADAEEIIKIDLATITSGTLTGIGFLGAGAILRKNDKQVIGSATGASIWAAGGIGLALGYGLYGLAVLACLGVFGILFVIGRMINED